MCSLFSVFTLFYVVLENLSTNVTYIDTCDVVYNWSISLLPPIVLAKIYLVKMSYCMR